MGSGTYLHLTLVHIQHTHKRKITVYSFYVVVCLIWHECVCYYGWSVLTNVCIAVLEKVICWMISHSLAAPTRLIAHSTSSIILCTCLLYVNFNIYIY